MDGATQETNDRIRGNGTYVRIMETLRRFQSKGISSIIEKCTLTPDNAHEYRDFCRLIQEMGFTPSISTFKQSGRGLNCYSYEAVCDSLSCLCALMYGDRDPKVSDDPYLLFSDHPCGLGRKKSAVIDPELNLLDCSSIRRELGSIRTNPSKALDAYSTIDYPSVDELPQCIECEVRYACHGGCRSIPYLAGDIRGRQPYCSLYRKRYRKLIWKDTE